MKNLASAKWSPVMLLVATVAGGGDGAGEMRPLLEKVEQASGGVRLRDAQSWTQTIHFKDPNEGVVTHRYFVELPDRFRLEAEYEEDTPDGKKRVILIDVVNGERAWQSKVYDGKMQGEAVVSGNKAAVMWSCRTAGAFAPMIPKLPGVQASLLGESKMDGRDVVGVRAIVDSVDWSERLYYDQKTGRLLKREFDGVGKNKKAEASVLIYDDYRDWDGVPLGRVRMRQPDGKLVTEATVIKLELGVKLDPKLFGKP